MCSPSGVPLGFGPPHTNTATPGPQQITPQTRPERENEGEKRAEEKATGERERGRGREKAKGPIGGQRRQEFLLAQGFGLIARRGEALAAAREEEVSGPVCL